MLKPLEAQLPGGLDGTDNRQTDRQHTDIATYRLNRPMAQFSENLIHNHFMKLEGEGNQGT